MYNRLLQTHIFIGLNPVESYQQKQDYFTDSTLPKKKKLSERMSIARENEKIKVKKG